MAMAVVLSGRRSDVSAANSDWAEGLFWLRIFVGSSICWENSVVHCHQMSPAISMELSKPSFETEQQAGFQSSRVLFRSCFLAGQPQDETLPAPEMVSTQQTLVLGMYHICLNDIDVTVVSRGSHHIFYRESSHVFSMMPSMLLGLLHQGSNASQALQLA